MSTSPTDVVGSDNVDARLLPPHQMEIILQIRALKPDVEAVHNVLEQYLKDATRAIASNTQQNALSLESSNDAALAVTYYQYAQTNLSNVKNCGIQLETLRKAVLNYDNTHSKAGLDGLRDELKQLQTTLPTHSSLIPWSQWNEPVQPQPIIKPVTFSSPLLTKSTADVSKQLNNQFTAVLSGEQQPDITKKSLWKKHSRLIKRLIGTMIVAYALGQNNGERQLQTYNQENLQLTTVGHIDPSQTNSSTTMTQYNTPQLSKSEFPNDECKSIPPFLYAINSNQRALNKAFNSPCMAQLSPQVVSFFQTSIKNYQRSLTATSPVMSFMTPEPSLPTSSTVDQTPINTSQLSRPPKAFDEPDFDDEDFSTPSVHNNNNIATPIAEFTSELAPLIQNEDVVPVAAFIPATPLLMLALPTPIRHHQPLPSHPVTPVTDQIAASTTPPPRPAPLAPMETCRKAKPSTIDRNQLSRLTALETIRNSYSIYDDEDEFRLPSHSDQDCSSSLANTTQELTHIDADITMIAESIHNEHGIALPKVDQHEMLYGNTELNKILNLDSTKSADILPIIEPTGTTNATAQHFDDLHYDNPLDTGAAIAIHNFNLAAGTAVQAIQDGRQATTKVIENGTEYLLLQSKQLITTATDYKDQTLLAVGDALLIADGYRVGTIQATTDYSNQITSQITTAVIEYTNQITETALDYTNQITTVAIDYSDQITTAMTDYTTQIITTADEYTNQFATVAGDYRDQITTVATDYTNQITTATVCYTNQITKTAAAYSNEMSSAVIDYSNQLKIATIEYTNQITTVTVCYANQMAELAAVYANQLSEGVESYTTPIAEAATDYTTQITEMASPHVTKITQIAGTYTSQITQTANQYIAEITKTIALYVTQISESASIYAVQVDQTASTYATQIGETAVLYSNQINASVEVFADAAMGIANQQATTVIMTWNGTKDAARGASNQAIDTVAGTATAYSNTAIEMTQSLTQSAIQSAEAFGQSVVEMAGTVTEKVTERLTETIIPLITPDTETDTKDSTDATAVASLIGISAVITAVTIKEENKTKKGRKAKTVTPTDSQSYDMEPPRRSTRLAGRTRSIIEEPSSPTPAPATTTRSKPSHQSSGSKKSRGSTDAALVQPPVEAMLPIHIETYVQEPTEADVVPTARRRRLASKSTTGKRTSSIQTVIPEPVSPVLEPAPIEENKPRMSRKAIRRSIDAVLPKSVIKRTSSSKKNSTQTDVVDTSLEEEIMPTRRYATRRAVKSGSASLE